MQWALPISLIVQTVILIFQKSLQAFVIRIPGLAPGVLVQGIVSRDGNAASTPVVVARPVTTGSPLPFHSFSGKVLLLVQTFSSPFDIEHLVNYPTFTIIFRIDYTSISKLDALTRIVDPSEINVESSLKDTKDHRDRIPVFLGAEPSHKPIQYVERAVRAQSKEIV
jgi:hypothetical protein